MKRGFLCVMMNTWRSMAALAAIAAVLIGGCVILGNGYESGGLVRLLANYLSAFPFLFSIFLLIDGTTFFTSYMGLALNMGSTRRNFFWGAQLNFPVLIAGGWLLQTVIDRVSVHMGWETLLDMGSALPSRNPALLPVLVMLLLMGCCVGILLQRRPKLGILLLVLCAVLGAGVFMLVMYIPFSQEEGLWGDLGWLIPTASAVASVIFEWVLWTQCRKMEVR